MFFPDRSLMWVLRLILSPHILQNLAIAVSTDLVVVWIQVFQILLAPSTLTLIAQLLLSFMLPDSAEATGVDGDASTLLLED